MEPFGCVNFASTPDPGVDCSEKRPNLPGGGNAWEGDPESESASRLIRHHGAHERVQNMFKMMWRTRNAAASSHIHPLLGFGRSWKIHQ